MRVEWIICVCVCLFPYSQKEDIGNDAPSSFFARAKRSHPGLGAFILK
jgi:hypothetical protein